MHIYYGGYVNGGGEIKDKVKDKPNRNWTKKNIQTVLNQCARLSL